VLYREIFFFLINEKLSTNLLEKEKSFAYYDLSLFLTNLYLRNRYSDLVLKILKTDQDLVLQFEVKNINLTKKLINALEYQKESFTRTKTSNFLKNISQIFSVISKYDIKLEKIELSNLSIVLYEDFQSKNKLFLSFDKNLSYRFLLDIFVRSYENLNLLKKNKELIEKKDLFLILIFTILSRKSLREMPKFISLADNSHRLINMFQTFLNDDFIRSQIKKINDLSEHALLKYIFHYLIHINYDIMSEEKKLKLNLIIKSKGNVVLRNFSYRLDWKPHKRVKLTQKEDISKALDLHKKLEREYLFSTGQKGKVTFFCKVKFQNPLKRGNEMLKKRIKLGMINIEKKKK
ncbi:MAG: hypothetical protein ACOC4M_16010, partial [Promethearchaeia archaeon]